MGKGGAGFVVAIAMLAIVGCGGGGSNSTVVRRHVQPKPTRLARPCGGEQLVVSHRWGVRGILSTAYTLFTVFNLSERACSTSGFPKLVALDADGRPFEPPAAHGTAVVEGPEGRFDIPGHGFAVFEASWSEDIFPPGACQPGAVRGYRVLLPGSHRVQTVPYPGFDRCMGPDSKGSLAVGRLELASESDLPAEPPELEAARPAERLPRCAAADLVVWPGRNIPGGAAAGTSYGHLEIANLSGRACKLSGVPRMVAVDLRGRHLGPPVGRSRSMPTVEGAPPIHVARLGPHGGSALFTFAVGEVLNYGTHGCEYRWAAGFDVTLPGARHAQYVPAPVRRCLHSVAPNGPQVSVGPIE
jgi:hypothetical protein